MVFGIFILSPLSFTPIEEGFLSLRYSAQNDIISHLSVQVFYLILEHFAFDT